MDSDSQSARPTHYFVEEEYTVQIPLVRPKSSFLQILKQAGATGEIFTKKEICDFLKNYIRSRRLYDEKDPRTVHCPNDLLAEVFGVESFTIDDVLSLLEENITYVPDTCLKTKTHLVKKLLPVSDHTENDFATDQSGGASQTVSRKPSSSGQESKEVSSSDNSVSCTSDTVLLSENSLCSLEVEKRERKKKKKKRKRKSEGPCEAPCSKTKERKRHHTVPQKQDSPQPGSSRRRGTSLSITYGDSKDGEYPSYLHVELDDDYDDDDDNYNGDVGSSFHQVSSAVSGIDDMWYFNEGSVTFEVESEPPFSESDLSSVRSGEELLVVCQESDVEFFADYSDTDDSDGKEFTEADNWSCVDCNLSNPPYQRFCNKCWKLRPDWLPNRRSSSDFDEGQRNHAEGKAANFTQKNEVLREFNDKNKKFKEKEVVKETLHSIFDVKSEKDCVEVADSGVGSLSSQPSSQETPPYFSLPKSADIFNDDTVSTTATSGNDLKPVSLLHESSLLESRHTFSNFQSKSLSSSSLDSLSSKSQGQSSDPLKVKISALDDPCIICLTKPKTASLIHGSSGHQVCCFSCAKRLKRRGKVCPVCRRPIQKVVKNYII